MLGKSNGLLKFRVTEIISAFEKQHRHNSIHAMRNFKLGHLKDQKNFMIERRKKSLHKFTFCAFSLS